MTEDYLMPAEYQLEQRVMVSPRRKLYNVKIKFSNLVFQKGIKYWVVHTHCILESGLCCTRADHDVLRQAQQTL